MHFSVILHSELGHGTHLWCTNSLPPGALDRSLQRCQLQNLSKHIEPKKCHMGFVSAESLSLPEEEMKEFLKLQFAACLQLALDGLDAVHDFV